MKALKLSRKTSFEIVPTKPFHFDSTFFKPGHFPSKDMKYEPGKRWQTMRWRGECLGTIFENAGTSAKPKVRVSIFSDKKLPPEFIESIKNEVVWRYNLDLDLSGFYRSVRQDPLLKPVVKRFYGLRPMHHGSLYEYLVIAIVLQNATVRRSVYMMQALFENFGTLLEFAGEKLWCFWEPKTLAKPSLEKKLRQLKMGYRAKSLIKVSEPFAAGTLDEMELRKEGAAEQAKALISLYGIGPASLGYIMLDVFHRWDFLNHISPWEQKIYNKIFFNKDWENQLVPVEKMLKHFNKWGEWKNLAVHYVWEDIWWTRLRQGSGGQERRNHKMAWLEKLIRL